MFNFLDLAPVAITILSALYLALLIMRLFLESKAAFPLNIVTFAFLYASSLLCGTGSVNDFLNFIRSYQFIIGLLEIKAGSLFLTSKYSAASTSIFLGSHPLIAHVPP